MRLRWVSSTERENEMSDHSKLKELGEMISTLGEKAFAHALLIDDEDAAKCLREFGFSLADIRADSFEPAVKFVDEAIERGQKEEDQKEFDQRNSDFYKSTGVKEM